MHWFKSKRSIILSILTIGTISISVPMLLSLTSCELNPKPFKEVIKVSPHLNGDAWGFNSASETINTYLQSHKQDVEDATLSKVSGSDEWNLSSDFIEKYFSSQFIINSALNTAWSFHTQIFSLLSRNISLNDFFSFTITKHNENSFAVSANYSNEFFCKLFVDKNNTNNEFNFTFYHEQIKTKTDQNTLKGWDETIDYKEFHFLKKITRENDAEAKNAVMLKNGTNIRIEKFLPVGFTISNFDWTQLNFAD
ncbi:MAG: hypothetical protein LBH55_00375 [Mycoplasmataceae bacterium]|nr:hypothetical protein [Mycoplasmataceae bacterium]